MVQAQTEHDRNWRERFASVRHLYIFGAPGKVGGAATKIRDMVTLLRDCVPITIVVSSREMLAQPSVREFERSSGVPIILRNQMPHSCEGVACVVCEPDVFTSGWAERIRETGLRLVFSNDMMWLFPGEREAASRGVVDTVLFVSRGQQECFAEVYAGTRQVIVPNYVNPDAFPYRERRNAIFTIGRLSRPDPAKYSLDFPVFYEELDIDPVLFRVQAWTEELRRLYAWHHFGPEWELLPPDKVPAPRFLQSLDAFVYPLGHRVVESWGRAVMEAMLTGCVPVVPAGHQFHDFIEHGRTGFIFEGFKDCREVVRALHRDRRLRVWMGRQAADHARTHWCDSERHREWWAEALCDGGAS